MKHQKPLPYEDTVFLHNAVLPKFMRTVYASIREAARASRDWVLIDIPYSDAAAVLLTDSTKERLRKRRYWCHAVKISSKPLRYQLYIQWQLSEVLLDELAKKRQSR